LPSASSTSSTTRRRSVWVRLIANPLTAASAAFLIAIHLLVFAGPLAWTVPPQQTSALDALLPPGPGHPLGTDDLGRDELSRLLHGGQVTLLVGFAAMLTAICLGLLVGATAAFYSGWLDTLLMRLTDTMTAPAFFLIVTAIVALGPGPITLIAVIGGTSWMQVARVIYGETLRFKAQDFVLAAEAMGARRAAILIRHVLPQTIPSVVVSATLGVGFAVLTESAVSYLGLGIQPPTPSWGNMLQNAQQYVWTSPGLAVFPGAVITLVVLAYNFLGDGLRDAIDPRLRV
jgi:peptide/nickel transport system permease protein